MIDNTIIKQLENESLDENFWFIKLGHSLNSEKPISSINENDLIFNFYENGKEFWNNHSMKIKELICDLDKCIPKDFVNELVNGDIRNIAETLLTLFIAKFEISLAIAIPLVSLVIKKKINNFCS